MNWRTETRVTAAPGFIEPCIPSPAKAPPKGSDWVWELKYDGYRLMVRKAAGKVRIYSRRGADFTDRFPLIVDAVNRLNVTSVLIDGEGVVYDRYGMPDFALLHSKQHDKDVSLIAFDLVELNGEPVRKEALAKRKGKLQQLVRSVKSGIEFNDFLEGEGGRIFEHACKLGHEGIVAKRKDLAYESGRSKRWLKIKNPDSPAMHRVRDEAF
jgi:bifunctional non-homologous end joining protein LigD